MEDEDKSLVINCKNCGAPLELEKTQSVKKCPFCLVVNKLAEIKEEDKLDHWIVPVKFNASEIRDELVGDLLKHPGCSDLLQSHLTITDVKLVFYPYWIITVHNRTEYEGKGQYATYHNRYKSGYKHIRFHLKDERGVFDDEREFTIYAAEEVDKELFNFEIATRGKRYYDKIEVEKVRAGILPSVLNVSQAKIEAVNAMREIHKGLIFKEIVQLSKAIDNPQIKGCYLLHIPFYFLTYSLLGKEYKATMDAATGRTVITQIPRTKGYYAKVTSLAIFFGLTVLAGLLIVVNFIEPLFFFAIYFVIAGTVLGIRTLQAGLRRKYRKKAK